MLEFISSGVLGSVFGGLFRLAPEVLKWLDRRDERKHELAMLSVQAEVEKVRGEYRVENRYIDFSVEQTQAIAGAFKQQGEDAAKSYRWVAALSALVRPTITYVLFGLYVAVKSAMIAYALSTGEPWTTVLTTTWTGEDFAMLNMILTFWFVGRSIEKREAK